MIEFEIIDIIDDTESSFKVEIEITGTRKRRFFSYPKHDGWEDEVEGKTRCILDIQHKLSREESMLETQSAPSIASIKEKHIGKKFGSVLKQKKIKKSVGVESAQG